MRIGDIKVGDTATSHNVVTRATITAFAEVSGDHNPVHVDEVFANATTFKGVVAHGILSASFISALLGTQLPGQGAVYLGQTLRFKAPVRPGDSVRTDVVVTEVVVDKRKVVLNTRCRVGELVVLEGEAVLLATA